MLEYHREVYWARCFSLFILMTYHVKHKQVSLYADDTVLYCFSANPNDLAEKLNADLHTVCDLLRENKLTLNIKKTKSMVIESNRKLSNISSITVHVNNNTIENVEHFSYL